MKDFNLIEGRLFLVFAVLYLLTIYILSNKIMSIIAGFSFFVGAIAVYFYFYKLNKRL